MMNLCKEVICLIEGHKSHITVDETRLNSVMLDIMRYFIATGHVEKCTNSLLKYNAIKSLRECLALTDKFRGYTENGIFDALMSNSAELITYEDCAFFVMIKRFSTALTEWSGVPTELTRLFLSMNHIQRYNDLIKDREFMSDFILALSSEETVDTVNTETESEDTQQELGDKEMRHDSQREVPIDDINSENFDKK
ncbi:hypothetical protein Btru_014200 [Bulinus truncatus]|nr:hypothetical protein Btru_014200 [Bulinus truncatus]